MPTITSVPTIPGQYADAIASADEDVIKLQTGVAGSITIFKTFSDAFSGIYTNNLQVLGVTFNLVGALGDHNEVNHNFVQASTNDGTSFPSDGVTPGTHLNTIAQGINTAIYGGGTELWGFNAGDWKTAVENDTVAFKITPPGSPGNIVYVDQITVTISYIIVIPGNIIQTTIGHLNISDGHIVI